MATSLTLGNQQIAGNDMLIKGIIESISTVNQFYQMLPFKGIHGNALAYNRELVGQDQMDLVNTLDTGASSINKDSQRFSRHSTELTTIIGDAQVNGLVQAVGSDFNDATAIQVAAKAKGIGRSYMNLLINGTSVLGGSGRTSGTPTFTDVSDITVEDFVYNVATAVLKTNPKATYDLSGSGDTGKAVTLTNLQADMDGLTTNNTILSLTIGTETFTMAVGASTALVSAGSTASGSTSVTLTTKGVLVYNAAINLINGYVGFDGLGALLHADQTDVGSAADIDVTTAAGAAAFFLALDTMIDRVHDKDGMVDYIMMHSRGVRKYSTALRSISAAGYDDVMEVKNSSGGVMKVQSYRGIPIFRNDFIQQSGGLAALTAGDGTVSTDDHCYVGTLDDGTFTHGICGLTASKAAGMQVQKIGARENVDAEITRVKWYCGLANFSELGLVRGTV